MAGNPFDPKYPGLLGVPPAVRTGNALSELARALGGAASDLFPPPKPALPVSSLPYTGALADFLGPQPKPALTNAMGAAVSDLFPTSPLSRAYGSLAGPFAPPPPKPVTPVVKRKAFFSFHYDDIMRVNVVRNAWKIIHPDNALMRSFYDSSLWESRKLEGDEAVKRLIRNGVEYTSAVCVLIGTDTWLRRWVRYEIARAVVDGRGLLGVHLNSIRHHQTQTPHTRGHNPLDFMAVGKVQPDVWKPARYYLFEKQAWPNGVGGYRWVWNRYSDYTDPVSLPSWLADPAPEYVTPLSQNASVYDYTAGHGHRNIGSWIDNAAQGAGR
jgi:hypothetical protein